MIDTAREEEQDARGLASLAGSRVLLVLDSDPFNYPPVINAARVFAAAGCEVLCLAGARMVRPPVALSERITVRYEHFGESGSGGVGKVRWGIGRLQLRRAVELQLRQWRPSLAIAYDHGAAWTMLRFATKQRRTTRVVFHLLDNVNREHLSWRSVRTWQWEHVYRRTQEFDALVVPDAMRGDELRRTWGVVAPYRVVPNAPQRQLPVRNDDLARRLNLPAGSRIAVVVGNMGMLAETARALARVAHDWHLVVIGGQSEAELHKLRAAAADAGVSARTHVFAYTDYDTMRHWLRGCAVGLAFHPTATHTVNWRFIGTSSVKVMEYCAAGIPSLVCSRSAFEQLAARTGALELLETEDEAGIADALDRMRSPSAWSERAEAAVHAHLTDLNAEKHLGALVSALPTNERSTR